MPRRTSITPIAARNRLEIFDSVSEPVSPNIRESAMEKLNTIPQIKILDAIEKKVGAKPNVLNRINEVVSTAGPTMIGTANGTTPIVEPGIGEDLETERRSRIDNIKRIAPPATRKSLSVMPRSAKTVLPTHRKTTATASAVKIDCRIRRLRSNGVSPCVSDKNIGIMPITSTATNIGTNAKK